ncbi:MAG TPA: threonine/serine exporter family protein [Friedmanniella sp.]
MTWSDLPGGRRWKQVRRRVNRVWADGDPPTLINGVPPLDLWDVQRPLPAPVDVEQQRSFDFAHRVGAVMLARGASMDDVEASIRAAALAMGLPTPEVDVTFTAIVVSVRPDPARPPLTSVSVVRQRSDDHSRLADTHQLLVALAAGQLDRKGAFDRLAAIEDRPHPYGSNAVTLARGVLAGAIVAQLGGTWAGAVVVATVAMLIDVIGRRLARHRIPTFYLNVVAGLVATLAAAVTTMIGAQQTPSLVVAGSIVVLLPGGTLVNGVRDGLSGFAVTANARVFEVLLVVAGLVGGVALGLALSRELGVDMSVNPSTLGLDALPVRLISAAVAATAAAITYYTPSRLLPAVALSGALGMLVLSLVQAVGIAGVASYAAAAFVVGLSGYVLSNAQRALPMMVVVPGILSLLPGLPLYAGLLELSTGQDDVGIVTIVDAGARGLAIAAAVLVAELIGQPVRRRILHRVYPGVRRAVGERPRL